MESTQGTSGAVPRKKHNSGLRTPESLSPQILCGDRMANILAGVSARVQAQQTFARPAASRGLEDVVQQDVEGSRNPSRASELRLDLSNRLPIQVRSILQLLLGHLWTYSYIAPALTHHDLPPTGSASCCRARLPAKPATARSASTARMLCFKLSKGQQQWGKCSPGNSTLLGGPIAQPHGTNSYESLKHVRGILILMD